MIDIENLITKALAKGLVEFAKEYNCGLVDLRRDAGTSRYDLCYIIDGVAYEITVRKEKE